MFFYEENGTLFFFKVIKYFFWVRIFLKFIYNYHIYGNIKCKFTTLQYFLYPGYFLLFQAEMLSATKNVGIIVYVGNCGVFSL